MLLSLVLFSIATIKSCDEKIHWDSIEKNPVSQLPAHTKQLITMGYLGSIRLTQPSEDIQEIARNWLLVYRDRLIEYHTPEMFQQSGPLIDSRTGLIASGVGERIIKIWNKSSKTLQKSIETDGMILKLDISPDGSCVAAITQQPILTGEAHMKIWSLTEGTVVKEEAMTFEPRQPRWEFNILTFLQRNCATLYGLQKLHFELTGTYSRINVSAREE